MAFARERGQTTTIAKPQGRRRPSWKARWGDGARSMQGDQQILVLRLGERIASQVDAVLRDELSGERSRRVVHWELQTL
jgi:hypothetical protein